jgi:hypothetical protein
MNDLVHLPVANFTVGTTRSSSLLPRRHRHQDPVVHTIAATAAAQRALEVHKADVIRAATAAGGGVQLPLVAADISYVASGGAGWAITSDRGRARGKSDVRYETVLDPRIEDPR